MKKNFCRRIKDSIDIVNEIGKYTSFKECGIYLRGTCPACLNENFSVTPLKQFYYCFDCQMGGDVIDFTMRKNDLTIIAAGNLLADMYNLPRYNPEMEDLANHEPLTEEQEEQIQRHSIDIWQHSLLLLEKIEGKLGDKRESIIHAALVMYFRKKLSEEEK